MLLVWNIPSSFDFDSATLKTHVVLCPRVSSVGQKDCYLVCRNYSFDEKMLSTRTEVGFDFHFEYWLGEEKRRFSSHFSQSESLIDRRSDLQKHKLCLYTVHENTQESYWHAGCHSASLAMLFAEDVKAKFTPHTDRACKRGQTFSITLRSLTTCFR